MRLNSGMTQEETLNALGEAALQAWGPEHLDARARALEQTARAIWTVMQVPLPPLGEEPDLWSPDPRPGREP